jgi:tetratricopeptide (TPR) repeat protein/DNA-binding Lrp family transcriptional regulator
VSAEVLRALANPATQSLLALLAVEPSYPRRLASLIGLAESEVARRLRRLEEMGLVRGAWAHVGKNVRMYELATNRVEIDITRGGLRIRTGQDQPVESIAVNPLAAPPPQPDAFFGRAAELRTLGGKHPVVLVEGMAGSGKTALLARYAALQSDPVLWVEFRGVESLGWLVNRVAVFLAQHGTGSFLAALEAGQDPKDLEQALIAGLDRRGLVVILDDLHLVTDGELVAFVDAALRLLRKGRIVLASRERIPHKPDPARIASMHLGGLEADAVAQFLRHKGFKVHNEQLARVHDEVGGHPLALNLLLEAAGSADGLEPLLDRRPEKDLERYLLQELDGGLSEGERTVLIHASLFRSHFSEEDVDAAAQRSLHAPLVALRRRLLVRGGPGRLWLPEVVRNYFYTRVADRKTLHTRVAKHFLASQSVPARLEAMYHFLQAQDHAQVLACLEQDLDLRDYDFIDAGYHRLYGSMLDLFSEESVGNPRTWALIQDEKGDLALHAGAFEQAIHHYQEARRLFAQEDDGERASEAAWKHALSLEKAGRAAEGRAVVATVLATAPDGPAKERLQEMDARLAR